MKGEFKRIKIAYLSANDPLDKRSWSGLTYYVGQSIQRNIGDVDFLGPVLLPRWLEKVFRGIAKATRLLFNKDYPVKYSLLLAWYYSVQLKKRIRQKQYDMIFAPASSPALCFFSSSIPIICINDSTFKLISNYYTNEFHDMCALSKWEGHFSERKALAKSAYLIYTSEWAAASAMKDYNVPATRIKVMPLAANMDIAPGTEVIFEKKHNSTLTLLYLAVEWGRKGGSIALDALKHLKEMDVPVKLIVCGCVPPAEFAHADMEIIPFLNKNKKQDHDRFTNLLSTSHFLILPTRADCSLLVACEANAYGMPAITTKTGGVPDIVKDGVNGYCLPYDAKGDEYAKLIYEIYSDEQRYHQLILSSRKRFETDLNWDVWAENFKEVYNTIQKQTPIKIN